MGLTFVRDLRVCETLYLVLCPDNCVPIISTFNIKGVIGPLSLGFEVDAMSITNISESYKHFGDKKKTENSLLEGLFINRRPGEKELRSES